MSKDTAVIKTEPVAVVQASVATPASSLQLAIEKGLDPVTIGKLMDLQERWDRDQARKAFVAAMAGFKRDCPSVIGKDMKADYGQGKAKYSYASTAAIVAAITPHLSKHGLHLYWESKQSANVITITCYVAHELGHKESAELTGPRDESGGKNPIQTIGSSVSYLQRYTMRSVLGLATADMDDDADNNPTIRPPVAMPKAKAAPPVPPATSEPAKNPSTSTLTGVIADVKESATKTGGVKFGIVIAGDERTFGTFSKTIGEAAKCFYGEGVEVSATVAPNGKYWDLVALEPMDANSGDTQEALPFE